MNKKTLVLGASDHPERYSFLAINRLKANGHDVVGIGKHKGTVAGIEILTEQIPITNVDTITLYLNPKHQQQYYNYILSLKPQRIIFNPGAENHELAQLALKNNIQPIEACTLVMLSTGQY
jgi:predicted CoA-binding protein